jgi:hypothetical protein
MTQRVNRRLTDLATAARKSGLKVIELPGWKDNASAGGEAYLGVGIHHTGSYDDIGDTSSDLAYAKWMAFEGRDDLDPPLMNLGLSAESVVYVGASGNANGMGEVRASGPMPYARDGNAVYIVIEAYNSGTQGWGTKGRDADGNEVTQYESYVRLCAALCAHYDWPASHVRAHWETSVTGKWDPGDPKGILRNGQRVMDMDKFRAAVARQMEEDDMALSADDKQWLREELNQRFGSERARDAAQRERDTRRHKAILAVLDTLAEGIADTATKAQVRRARDDIAALSEPDPETPEEVN